MFCLRHHILSVETAGVLVLKCVVFCFVLETIFLVLFIASSFIRNSFFFLPLLLHLTRPVSVFSSLPQWLSWCVLPPPCLPSCLYIPLCHLASILITLSVSSFRGFLCLFGNKGRFFHTWQHISAQPLVHIDLQMWKLLLSLLFIFFPVGLGRVVKRSAGALK